MRYSNEEKERIISEYISGAELKELCNKYNLAYGTVQAWLIKSGCIRNYNPYHIKVGNRIKQDYILHEDYAEIKIRRKNGFSYIKIDIEDVQKCKEYGIWTLNGNGYISSRSRETKNTVYLHRFVLGVSDKDVDVDHINHDLFDCRKANLRCVTISQNMMNRRISGNNSSGVTGVSFDKYHNKWEAGLIVSGKKERKLFDTFDEAVLYRKELEEKYFGEYRYNRLNDCKLYIIKDSNSFIKTCKRYFSDWCYTNLSYNVRFNEIYVVSSFQGDKTYNVVFTAHINDDSILAEYTYNGDKKELYEDAYKKLTNRCIKE